MLINQMVSSVPVTWCLDVFIYLSYSIAALVNLPAAALIAFVLHILE